MPSRLETIDALSNELRSWRARREGGGALLSPTEDVKFRKIEDGLKRYKFHAGSLDRLDAAQASGRPTIEEPLEDTQDRASFLTLQTTPMKGIERALPEMATSIARAAPILATVASPASAPLRAAAFGDVWVDVVVVLPPPLRVLPPPLGCDALEDYGSIIDHCSPLFSKRRKALINHRYASHP